MSERQILITRYTTHLSRATSARYQLFFLRTEKDAASRTMLTENLEKILADTNNETLRKAINNAKQGSDDISFGQHSKNKANKLSKDIQDNHRMGMGGDNKDYKQSAMNQYAQLYLEDALKSFSKGFAEIRQRQGRVSTNDKMYAPRTEINLVLGNYAEALSLAQKGNLDDMAFVAALSNGDFEIAKKYIRSNIQRIKRNTQDRNLIATTYELMHLILFVLFATSSTSETKELSDELFRSSSFTLNDLKEWRDLFCQRNFSHFLQKISEMKKIFQFSIYTAPVVDKLSSAIIQNVVVLYLFPLARASIGSLCSDLNISTQDAISYIQTSIRNQKLNGKIDFISNSYNGSLTLDNEHNEMKSYFNQLMEIRRDFQINLWMKEYNATQRKK